MSNDLQVDKIKTAIQKTVEYLNDIDDRYRDAAFPIILTNLLSPIPSVTTKSPENNLNEHWVKEDTKSLKITSQSVGEFFKQISPTSHNDRFVCAAYYFLKSGKTEFTVSEILETYTKARITKPGNPGDVIAQNVKKTYFTDAPSSSSKNKFLVLTDTGEKFVEELLNDKSK